MTLFIAGFFSFNMIIAVLKTHYGETASHYLEEKEAKKDKIKEKLREKYSIAVLKYYNYFEIIKV